MAWAAGAPLIVMFLLILCGGAISDKLLQNGKSRFVARASIAIIGFVVFCISLFMSIQTNNLVANVLWLSLCLGGIGIDRKSTRLNSSHVSISYAVFCLIKIK